MYNYTALITHLYTAYSIILTLLLMDIYERKVVILNNKHLFLFVGTAII